MAAPVRIAKNLATGTNSASVRIRAAQPPYAFMATGGFTGTVALQHTTANTRVADADATWDSLGNISNADTLDISHPLSRVRINGTSILTGTATVDMLEDATNIL